MKIGFFDSGVGGLFALKKFMSYDVECFYFADTAHMPYGSKTYTELLQRCVFIVQHLLQYNVEYIVIPCNTAVITLADLQKQFPQVQFIQAVDYTVQKVALHNPKKVAVMATQAVTDSGLYEKKIQQAGYEVVSIACPQLATHVEKNDEQGMHSDVHTYCELIAQDLHIEVLVLGCTHYARVKNDLQKKLPEIKIIESDDHVDLLLHALRPGVARVHYFVSGEEIVFFQIVESVLQ